MITCNLVEGRVHYYAAVTCLRRSVTDLTPRGSGFDSRQIYLGSVVQIWHWNTFLYEHFGLSLSVSFHQHCVLIFNSDNNDAM